VAGPVIPSLDDLPFMARGLAGRSDLLLRSKVGRTSTPSCSRFVRTACVCAYACGGACACMYACVCPSSVEVVPLMYSYSMKRNPNSSVFSRKNTFLIKD
jgi:hypothetical protein